MAIDLSIFPPELIKLFRELGKLSEIEIERLLSLWSHSLTLPKGAFLSTPDRCDLYMYFVMNGVLRIFCVGQEGEEVCLAFSYKNSFTGSYPSLITGKPSTLYVQALQDCTLIGANWQDFVTLSTQMPAIERFRRILAEETLLGRMQREIELLTLSPAERYEQFLQRSAPLLQLIPQKHIASYLGMTPETLSRIRGNLNR